MEHEDACRWAELLAERSMLFARKVARRMGYADPEEAESLALERLAAALRRYEGPPSEDEVWLWVKRCIRNALKNLVRRDSVKFVVKRSLLTEDTTRSVEAREELLKALKQLPPKRREIVRLHLQGWTNENIAEKLNKRLNSIHNQLLLAQKNLQNRLG
jgi:RNA polymerase sigma factor (sigma-70 family)